MRWARDCRKLREESLPGEKEPDDAHTAVPPGPRGHDIRARRGRPRPHQAAATAAWLPNRLGAIADEFGVDRALAHRIAVEVQRNQEARVMRIDGVEIETVHDLSRYTYAQISRAYAIARMLGRGKLVLVEALRR